jgi:hypothetical protein
MWFVSVALAEEPDPLTSVGIQRPPSLTLVCEGGTGVCACGGDERHWAIYASPEVLTLDRSGVRGEGPVFHAPFAYDDPTIVVAHAGEPLTLACADGTVPGDAGTIVVVTGWRNHPPLRLSDCAQPEHRLFSTGWQPAEPGACDHVPALLPHVGPPFGTTGLVLETADHRLEIVDPTTLDVVATLEAPFAHPRWWDLPSGQVLGDDGHALVVADPVAGKVLPVALPWPMDTDALQLAHVADGVRVTDGVHPAAVFDGMRWRAASVEEAAVLRDAWMNLDSGRHPDAVHRIPWNDGWLATHRQLDGPPELLVKDADGDTMRTIGVCGLGDLRAGPPGSVLIVTEDRVVVVPIAGAR